MKIAPVMFNTVKPAHNLGFKSNPNILTRTFDEFESEFDEKIVPFMNDSRTLYIETGKIGYNAQQVVNFVKFKENQLFQYKLNIQDAAKEKLHPGAKLALDAMEQYEQNKRTFASIEKMSNLPIYNKTGLKSKIAKAKSDEFLENNEFEKIKPITDYIRSQENNFENKLSSINLKNSGKIYQKYTDTNECLLSAQYFMLITPYNDAMKLKLQRDEFQKTLKSPKININTGLDRLDRMQKSADKIINQKEFFYNGRENMKKFVDTNRNRQLPSIQEFNDVYENLKQKCNSTAQDFIKDANNFYRENVKNINFDPEKAKNTLNRQKAVNDELFAIIDEAKTAYLAEHNKDFYKS